MTATAARPFSVAELAALACVSRRFVHKCIVTGTLPASRVGAHYRIRRSVGLAFAVACGVEIDVDPAAHNGHAAHSIENSEHIAHSARGAKFSLAQRR